jgi:hypothetical protein
LPVLQVPVLPQGFVVVVAHDMLLQQIPLMQLLFWHSMLVAHVCPSGFFKQLPPWHVNGVTQSVFAVQVVLHAPATQAYGEQPGPVVGATHIPAPLQVDGASNVDPLHVAPAHWVPATCCWQAPRPLQDPVLPHGAAALVAHWPAGAVAPFGMLAQVPGLPGTLHDLQVPQEAAPQQTPSVQKSSARHSLVAAQSWPRRLLVPQSWVMGSHIFGDRHWASAEHAE